MDKDVISLNMGRNNLVRFHVYWSQCWPRLCMRVIQPGYFVSVYAAFILFCKSYYAMLSPVRRLTLSSFPSYSTEDRSLFRFDTM
jgi:hypothetical protein